MARLDAGGRADRGADCPQVVVVEVTVLGARRHRPPPSRIWRVARTRRTGVIVALGLAASIAAALGLWVSDGDSSRPLRAVQVRDPGPAGVAAAYGYPLGCLTVTLLATDRTYARADFDHRTPCGRYTGYPTAIFHYRSGAWRPVLDAIAYACPIDWLPARVQTGFGVCPGPKVPAR